MRPVEVIYRNDAARIPIPSIRVVEAKPKPAGDDSDKLSKVREWMKKLRPSHPCKAAFEEILAGRSFADPGSRNDAMYQVVSTIAWLTPARDLAIRDLLEILKPSLSIWASEESAEKTLDEELEVAAGMFESAIENRAEKDTQKAEVLGGIARGFSRALRKNGEQVIVNVGVGSTDPKEVDLDSIIPIIQYQDVFFTYSFGLQENPLAPNYYGPFVKSALKTQLKDCCANVPEEIFTFLNEVTKIKKDGTEETTWKIKTHDQLLAEYAAGCHDVIGHIDLQESFFDVVTRQFHQAVCPFRVTEPRFSPEIDEWLRLLGGEKADRLLDWLAAVPIVDRQLCALYLEGAPGVGKNLLSNGLSRLWREAGPADFIAIMNDFNADMFKCPLVLLDEGLPKKVSQTSAFVRTLIGSSEHTRRQKKIPDYKIIGCLRLMITANDDHVVSQLANEDLAENSAEAISERLLHILADDQAADWIRYRNAIDRATIDAWIKEDLIARHVIWLCENREVKEGRRFRVDGEAMEMTRALMSRGEKQELVLEWLARFALKPDTVDMFYKTKKAIPLARIGNGQLLVNSQVIFDVEYRPALKDRLTPTTVGRILKQLSHPINKLQLGPRGDRVKYHSVNYDNVKQIAGTLQFDVDKMEEHLMRDGDWELEPGPRRPKLKLVPMKSE